MLRTSTGGRRGDTSASETPRSLAVPVTWCHARDDTEFAQDGTAKAHIGASAWLPAVLATMAHNRASDDTGVAPAAGGGNAGPEDIVGPVAIVTRKRGFVLVAVACAAVFAVAAVVSEFRASDQETRRAGGPTGQQSPPAGLDRLSTAGDHNRQPRGGPAAAAAHSADPRDRTVHESLEALCGPAFTEDEREAYSTDAGLAQVAQHPGNCIFFEMAGVSFVSPVSQCGIESAARAHPNRTIVVVVYLTSPEDLPGMSHLSALPNVHFVSATFRAVLSGVPGIDEWALRQPRPIIALLGGSRQALLYKYGGVFLDLDCMVLRPLDGLRNTLGLQRHRRHCIPMGPGQDDMCIEEGNNAVLIFDRGNVIVREAVRATADVYTEADAANASTKWGSQNQFNKIVATMQYGPVDWVTPENVRSIWAGYREPVDFYPIYCCFPGASSVTDRYDLRGPRTPDEWREFLSSQFGSPYMFHLWSGQLSPSRR